MHTYEFTFLVEDSKSIIKLEETLQLYKGKKIKEESLGKKLLAYPIHKKTAAEYYTWLISLDKKMVKDFKQKLNFENVVMRYLMLEREEPRQKKDSK